MTVATVYKQGWTLDEVPWSLFDPGMVDPDLLAAVKAAALVEYNAPDYVSYLKRVFADDAPEMMETLERWGREESQHGRALGRWAELADPTFKLEEAFARFRNGYSPPHFGQAGTGSVRGSRRGEMIARCVVESGTSSYYTAMRDICDEPVLRDIVGRIAADEYRHYKLFYETMCRQNEPELSLWRKLRIAIGRVVESDDDELAFSYYCANVKPEEEGVKPYNRKKYAHLAASKSMSAYRRKHIQKLMQMVAKALGLNPHGWFADYAGSLLWWRLQKQAQAAA